MQEYRSMNHDVGSTERYSRGLKYKRVQGMVQNYNKNDKNKKEKNIKINKNNKK